MRIMKKMAVAIVATALVATGVSQATAAEKKDKKARKAVSEFKAAKREYRDALAEYTDTLVDYQSNKVSQKAAQAEFKAAMDAWKLASAEAREARKAIRLAFEAEVATATTARDEVLNSETATDEEKLAAQEAFEVAFDAAKDKRDQLLEAVGPLGNPPSKPTKPSKPAKPGKPSKPAKPVR
jgi:type II secretory pathway pseudopilin PulG